ncbi:MAG TPA: LysM domain-containing protein, partial [Anaerolineales bacterium]|nr:LysM domain-containing protein [Anaerolineales bacterium]
GHLTMDELVILAENLMAQTETPILYTYTIEDGDTCVGIAQRYGVTPERIAEVNGMENCDLIVAGQPLLVPLPTARQTVAEADLNCDGKLERVRAIPDPLLGDLSANFGIVVEAIPEGGDQYWPIWQETIADVTAVFFGLPQIYEVSRCESFLGITIFAGEGQHSGLDLYQWDGTALQQVLDANGFAKEFTPPGTTPFRITTQSLVRDVAAGGCTRTATTYEWDGTAFVPVEEIREEGVECLER